MANGYFNNQVRSGLSGGKGADPGGPSGNAPAFKEKPGFNFKGTAPGKVQSRDRSGGVKRARVRPDDEGL